MYKNMLMHVTSLYCQKAIPVPAMRESVKVVAIFRILSFTFLFLTLRLEIRGYLKSPAVPATTLLRHWHVDSIPQNCFKVFQTLKKTKFTQEVILTGCDLHMHLLSMLTFSIKRPC